MTNSAVIQSVEVWLREFASLLGSASSEISRGQPVSSRAKDEGEKLVWWRVAAPGAAGSAPPGVWIGASATDIAVVCAPTEGGDGESGDSEAEFAALLNRASGSAGELTIDSPRAVEYETFRIPTPAIGEMTIFVALIQSQPDAVDGMGALMDVELPLTLRFGSTHMPLQELASLSVGSVIEFDGALNDPVELVVNGRVIARGEAVVLQGCYALRISEIASRQERLFSADYKSSEIGKTRHTN
jgi:flagellar motor switch protein FliN/FliY